METVIDRFQWSLLFTPLKSKGSVCRPDGGGERPRSRLWPTGEHGFSPTGRFNHLDLKQRLIAIIGLLFQLKASANLGLVANIITLPSTGLLTTWGIAKNGVSAEHLQDLKLRWHPSNQEDFPNMGIYPNRAGSPVQHDVRPKSGILVYSTVYRPHVAWVTNTWQWSFCPVWGFFTLELWLLPNTGFIFSMRPYPM